MTWSKTKMHLESGNLLIYFAKSQCVLCHDQIRFMKSSTWNKMKLFNTELLRGLYCGINPHGVVATDKNGPEPSTSTSKTSILSLYICSLWFLTCLGIRASVRYTLHDFYHPVVFTVWSRTHIRRWTKVTNHHFAIRQFQVYFEDGRLLSD